MDGPGRHGGGKVKNMKNGKLACRFCGKTLDHAIVDLGMSPLANSYLKPGQLLAMEPFYPLKVYVCDSCFLMQLPAFQRPDEIFSDYAYFSSYSDAWLAHARKYTEVMIERFGFNRSSQVVEIASNDGYLLKNFAERGVPVLGIEPAANVAAEAIRKGIATIVDFFGAVTAANLVEKGIQAGLLIGNNVLAHVPDINDFVSGMKLILKPDGIITMEFPHLMCLMTGNQFDTIYHEHFSYFSFITVEKIFSRHGLSIFDVDELPTHGGSLRIYACHSGLAGRSLTENVHGLRQREMDAGYDDIEFYKSFASQVTETKRKALEFLIKAKKENKSIAAYGAPAKGNTLLNYCGISTDFIDYTVDRSPHKQGRYLPGTHIPIYGPEKIEQTRPDYLVILPWNLKEEIMGQMAHIRKWGGRFAVLIPEARIL